MHSRFAILEAERALASIESDLRRATSKTLHVYLEALADAYVRRPAGHRLDNIDRALLSYRLAVRLSSLTPSLSAKLGSTCFLRLQTISRTHLPTPTLLSQHLATARHYLDTAVRRFEDEQILQSDSNTASVYTNALLCRALVYDTMYQTVDREIGCEFLEPRSANTRAARAERRRKRNLHISSCIESSEKLLSIVNMSYDNMKSDSRPKFSTKADTGDLSGGIHPVNKARAVMCLARAYSNVEDTRVGGIAKAVTLLKSVEGILSGVDDEEQLEWAGLGPEVLQQMREDAQAQQLALEASRTNEGGCVVT